MKLSFSEMPQSGRNLEPTSVIFSHVEECHSLQIMVALLKTGSKKINDIQHFDNDLMQV